VIEVDTSSLREKIRRTKSLFAVTETAAYGLADYFLTVLRARTPKDSGATAQSWTIHYHKTTDAIVWEISPDGREKEVEWLEFGTKPHVIEAHGKVLRFEIGGDVVFASKVYHPGTKPLGFVRLTQDDLDKSAREIGAKLLQNIQNIWV
jgi:hypothetical protein